MPSQMPDRGLSRFIGRHGSNECRGEVRVGELGSEVGEQLLGFKGTWLEYSPEDRAIVVRHVTPEGCPAISAIPCELLSLLDLVPDEQRVAMPGGALFVTDPGGHVLRVRVDRGEVRIQWAREDFSRPMPADRDEVLSLLPAAKARVNGWARFGGSREAIEELRTFVEGFEGLYPSWTLEADLDAGAVDVRFLEVNVGPEELANKLQSLARPPESLEAELRVGSFGDAGAGSGFLVRIHQGRVEMMRPSLWDDN